MPSCHLSRAPHTARKDHFDCGASDEVPHHADRRRVSHRVILEDTHKHGVLYQDEDRQEVLHQEVRRQVQLNVPVKSVD